MRQATRGAYLQTAENPTISDEHDCTSKVNAWTGNQFKWGILVVLKRLYLSGRVRRSLSAFRSLHK